MSKEYQPPKWATRFLKWFCSEELLEEIQGDLWEAYQHRREKRGKFKADMWYISDVFKFFKPYSFEKFSRSKQFLPMFSNYFKIAARNILKRKSYTALNLFGLTAGISCVLLVSLYLHHELTYDQSVPESESIYRLHNSFREQTYTCMRFPAWYSSTAEEQLYLTQKLNSYDQVLESCHFVPNESAIGPNSSYYVQVDGKRFVEREILFTNQGASFQSLFPLNFLIGSPEQSFSKFSTICISEDQAAKFFGKKWRSFDLIGRSIQIQDETFELTGVFENLEGNLHYTFDILVHQSTIPSWGAYTYMKLADGRAASSVMSQLNAEVDAIFPGYTDNVLQKGITAMPLTSIHFSDGMLYELKPNANEVYLVTFGIIGVIILLIIWTNYTNLSIATYSNRQKEIGVRKVMGAQANDVVFQVMTEAVFLTLLCLPFVWLVVFLTLPSFNQLMQISMDTNTLWSAELFMILIGILVITGVISSVYPAVLFGKKSLLRLFYGSLSSAGSRHFNLRNTILAAQFFMLIVLLSMVFVIQRQMDFIQNKELGFDKDGIIFFDVDGAEKYHQLKQELVQLPEVEEVATGLIPGASIYNQLTYEMKGGSNRFADGTHIETSASSLAILGIESSALNLLEGQDSVFIINETAARKLAASEGVQPNELIGRTIVLEPEWENDEFGYGLHYSIADIIQDFDYFNLKHASQPLMIEVQQTPGWAFNALVKLNTNNLIETIAAVEEAYLSVEKERPFELTFLDAHLDQLYQQEKNAGVLVSLLTSVAIILTVMGLIGILSFVTLIRQKEIGVRKVFGASIAQILLSLGKSYIYIILLATLVAMPVAFLLADHWLSSFAYRISPDYFTVVLAGLFTLVIVAAVVILQSYKSANMNPSDTLRYE